MREGRHGNRQSGNFTEPEEQKTRGRSEDRGERGKEVTGIRGQKMKALRRGSVSAEGLVLLFFCVFEKNLVAGNGRMRLPFPVGTYIIENA